MGTEVYSCTQWILSERFTIMNDLTTLSVNEAVEMLLVRFDENATDAHAFWCAKVMDNKSNLLPLDFVCAVANALKKWAEHDSVLAVWPYTGPDA